MPQKFVHWLLINLLAAYLPSVIVFALAARPDQPWLYLFAPVIFPIVSFGSNNPLLFCGLLVAFVTGVACLSFCFRAPGGRAFILVGLLVMSLIQALWV
jgi:hypothetical protein